MGSRKGNLALNWLQSWKELFWAQSNSLWVVKEVSCSHVPWNWFTLTMMPSVRNFSWKFRSCKNRSYLIWFLNVISNRHLFDQLATNNRYLNAHSRTHRSVDIYAGKSISLYPNAEKSEYFAKKKPFSFQRNLYHC